MKDLACCLFINYLKFFFLRLYLLTRLLNDKTYNSYIITKNMSLYKRNKYCDMYTAKNFISPPIVKSTLKYTILKHITAL